MFVVPAAELIPVEVVAREGFEVAGKAETAFRFDALKRPAFCIGVVGSGNQARRILGGRLTPCLGEVKVWKNDIGDVQSALRWSPQLRSGERSTERQVGSPREPWSIDP